MFLLLFAIAFAAFIVLIVMVLEAYQPKNLRKRSKRRTNTDASRRMQPKRQLPIDLETERQSYVKRETSTLLYAMCGGDRDTAERLASRASGDTLQKRWEHAIDQLVRDRR